MTQLKAIKDKIAAWPTWAKVTGGILLFTVVNAILNPQPVVTEQQKAAIAQRDAAEEKERNMEKLQTQAVVYAHEWVKSNLNDPDSVEWQGTFIYPNMDVCVNFSAKNAFNGRVKGYAAIIDGNMTMNNAKVWNKRCGDSGAVRYY